MNLLRELNYTKKMEIFERILRKHGLTEKQIEAGKKYYINFCLKFDINPAKGARMFISCIENMKKGLMDVGKTD